MTSAVIRPDVLCVGHASYDLVFQVSRHPLPDEKMFAEGFIRCGGGPAANAAVTVARLGLKAAFSGYLGRDLFGEEHVAELNAAGILTDWLVRGDAPTPLSAVFVKPDGARALVTHKAQTDYLESGAVDFSACRPQVVLFDGHEPLLSEPLAERARAEGVPTVLDAGSLHQGTEMLMKRVDHLVASEKFARQVSGATDPRQALEKLAEFAPTVVVTLGERGLVWKTADGTRGSLPAVPVNAIDTTGAGDSFHGAYAAALAEGQDWSATLRFASAVAALCCTRIGARLGIPGRREVEELLSGTGVNSRAA
ncbi:MAG TPA: PfkB family carbohydrate kinase [Methylococcaceae bacterium]|nr:PfkB family carbohydrate kinase [Methylococcaceae bacterium]